MDVPMETPTEPQNHPSQFQDRETLEYTPWFPLNPSLTHTSSKFRKMFPPFQDVAEAVMTLALCASDDVRYRYSRYTSRLYPNPQTSVFVSFSYVRLDMKVQCIWIVSPRPSFNRKEKGKA